MPSGALGLHLLMTRGALALKYATKVDLTKQEDLIWSYNYMNHQLAYHTDHTGMTFFTFLHPILTYIIWISARVLHQL